MTTTATTQDEQPRQLTLRERLGLYNPDGSVQHLKALLYGEPSSGKTHILGTLPNWPEEFLPAMIIDVDGGMDTIRNITQVEITPQVKEPNDLKKIYDEVAAESTSNSCPFRTIALDHVTELQKIDMNHVMAEAKLKANDPDKVNIYVPSEREWGIEAERLRITIRSFRNLPCHFICLAHAQIREDKISKIHSWGPQLGGQMRNGIVGFFSVAGFQSVYTGEDGDSHRQIQFKKTPKVQARDRFQVLPELMKDDPTIPQIWKIIKDSGAKIVEDDPLDTSSVAQQLQGAISQ